jgi:hypothetical protein
VRPEGWSLGFPIRIEGQEGYDARTSDTDACESGFKRLGSHAVVVAVDLFVYMCASNLYTDFDLRMSLDVTYCSYLSNCTTNWTEGDSFSSFWMLRLLVFPRKEKCLDFNLNGGTEISSNRIRWLQATAAILYIIPMDI